MHVGDNIILVCKPWLAHKPFYLVFPFCWCQGLDVIFASSSLHFYVRVPIETCVASTSIYNHIHVITHPIVTPTIDSIVKGLETGLINTFPADSPRCAVDNIVDSSMVASNQWRSQSLKHARAQPGHMFRS